MLDEIVLQFTLFLILYKSLSICLLLTLNIYFNDNDLLMITYSDKRDTTGREE